VKVVNRKSQKMKVDHLQFRHRHPTYCRTGITVPGGSEVFRRGWTESADVPRGPCSGAKYVPRNKIYVYGFPRLWWPSRAEGGQEFLRIAAADCSLSTLPVSLVLTSDHRVLRNGVVRWFPPRDLRLWIIRRRRVGWAFVVAQIRQSSAKELGERLSSFDISDGMVAGLRSGGSRGFIPAPGWWWWPCFHQRLDFSGVGGCGAVDQRACFG